MKIFETVSAIILDLAGVKTITPELDLQKDLALDSLEMVTLLVMLEEIFEITLDESDMNPFDLTTVADVVKLVEKYVDGDSDETQKKRTSSC